nr:PREDICTED: zinc finger protein 467-like [Linepithema humile]
MLLFDDGSGAGHALRKRRSFICGCCDRRYINKKDLNKHVTYSCGKSPRFKCPYCSKPLYSRTCYVPSATSCRRRYCGRPLTTTRGNFECPKCRKTYKWYRGLHRHLEYECGKSPRFQCPHCPYAGKHRSHVYSHIKTNHQNRPIYAVDMQQDPFLKWFLQSARCSQKTAFYRHPCPNCHRSYKHRSHMMRHYRYECGILQRFECPYCKHHLRQRTHVWTHIRTFHPNSELYCIDVATNAKLSWQEYRND